MVQRYFCVKVNFVHHKDRVYNLNIAISNATLWYKDGTTLTYTVVFSLYIYIFK